MENRELKVLLSKNMAKKWYKSNDDQLKLLALSVYSAEELEEVTIDDIMTNVQESYPELWDKMGATNHIEIVAKYFNGDWKKKDGIIGHFYVYNENTKVWDLRLHNTVTYPGVIYYKDIPTARKAFEYLKEHYDNII